MSESPAALVTGKFYPPHAGHLHLLRRALELRERVVVLLLGSSNDSISPARRENALFGDAADAGIPTARLHVIAGHDEAPYDLDSETVWASHIETFRAYLRSAPPVDVVVAGEPYVIELARRMGIGCEQIDRVGGMSSTAIRRDPVGMWATLGPGTRSMLCTRVVLLGAESTGTTTISQLLAERLRSRGGPWAETEWVPEIGRQVMIAKQDEVEESTGVRPIAVEWTYRDFINVAEAQCLEEMRLAASGGPILVCDTDVVATEVWQRRYLGASDVASLFPRSGDVYLLTHHDGVPFIQDGLRDGEDIRADMTDWFVEELTRRGLPWAMLTGSLDERVDLAERIADLAMSRKLALAEPI